MSSFELISNVSKVSSEKCYKLVGSGSESR